ncbi:hypothetical protein MASR2M74_35160 [Paracoccaceae bacterium]
MGQRLPTTNDRHFECGDAGNLTGTSRNEKLCPYFSYTFPNPVLFYGATGDD